jgi:FeS assembly SUF system protein
MKTYDKDDFQNLSPQDLEEMIIEQLKNIYDPEIPVDIYNLGLIYNVVVDDDKNAFIEMTLTAPNCPVADALPEQVRQRIASLPGVNNVKVELTFDPPWSKDFISEEGKLMLGML